MNDLISAIVGAFMALGPDCLCAWIFLKYTRFQAASLILKIFYATFFLKFFLTFILFAGIFSVGIFSALPLFIGFIVGQLSAIFILVLLTNIIQQRSNTSLL